MRRRTVLAAAAAALVSGCTDSDMTWGEEPDETFDDITRIEAPTGSHEHAVRCIDREAGVVIWAMNAAGSHAGEGVGMTALPLEETDL